jgi:pimeloyl-ACP methyl ester carboxylesterase
MSTQYAISSDGARIAYDLSGAGPALLLLHGAGKMRSDWHKAGYVRRLVQDFTVVTIDARGVGESEAVTGLAAFSIEQICDDVLAVADSCGIARFAVWGYSFGGNVARYLGAWSERVSAIAIIGVPFGPAVTPEFDRYIDEFTARYGQIAERSRSAAGDASQMKSAVKGSIATWVACFQAMRAWPAVDAAEMMCPAMLLAGSRNRSAMTWIDANRQELDSAGVRVEIVPGLDHPAEFSQLDKVFPPVIRFLLPSAHRP